MRVNGAAKEREREREKLKRLNLWYREAFAHPGPKDLDPPKMLLVDGRSRGSAFRGGVGMVF